ncbi:adenylyl-sulfate reductase [Solemya velesiana gill symbiont]|uniref:Adenylyl-sulfate reductase n=2 Tax=Solemya velesiana gill symbiont TaxID=1918948 RepID=A0A1T2KS61_9GAMM|nr:adenylyl-sulfate reductase [Solemya velesiana gill symbiont]
MQMYVILMVILVVGGVVLDMVHKKSAKYFFENSKKAQKNAKRTVSSGEKVSLAVQTVASEVITSSEFCNPARRVSHLFLMYGFIIFVVSTATLIFGYPTAAEAGIWPMLWHLGAAMVAIGGYWFWFLIRVDRYSEGAPLARLVRADLFIVSLLATVTFALIWSFAGAGLAGWNMLFFGLFVISATVLFGGVIWSKFAHMFFKPAAAYQKKITKADGSQENLPDVGEMNDPAIHARYPDIPEYMGTNPPNMGLGIKRESPNHY